MTYPDILLKQASSNAPYVRVLKEKLNEQGFGPLDVNNPNFGESTEAAVIAFQRAKLLNPDGEVGPLTWHRLFTDRIAVIAQSTTLNGRSLEILLTQLYVREKTGHNDGKEVEAYLNSVGLNAGYAWCVACQYWAVANGAAELSVYNPLPRTGGVHDMWHRLPPTLKVTDPQKGDLMFLDFGHGTGHLTRIKKREGINLATIEGNTFADPTSAIQDRDGQGMFERLRKTTMKQIIGYARIP
ncbi:MAG TPA: peptidoglycan-binding domain-containing protein [Chryseolinea sp.]|nr:peptidoglycan-binding domain-containing protein [Chryseolinea sp.]